MYQGLGENSLQRRGVQSLDGAKSWCNEITFMKGFFEGRRQRYGGLPHTIAAGEGAQILEGHPGDAGDAVAALDSLSQQLQPLNIRFGVAAPMGCGSVG